MPGAAFLNWGWAMALLGAVVALAYGAASGSSAPPGDGVAALAVAPQVANANDTSFTVVWMTSVTTTGYVRYGTTRDSTTWDPDSVAYDYRNGTQHAGPFHFVRVGGVNPLTGNPSDGDNLLPSTTYYFDVVSGDSVDNNSGFHYSIVTGPTLQPPAPGTLFGRVLQPDGSPATGGVVFVTIVDTRGVNSSSESQSLAALVLPDGFWSVSRSNARTPNLTSYFISTPGIDKLRLSAQGPSGSAGPVEVLIPASGTEVPSLQLSSVTPTPTATPTGAPATPIPTPFVPPGTPTAVTIGPGGGIAPFGYGSGSTLVLEVPPGAFTEATRLTYTQQSLPPVPGMGGRAIVAFTLVAETVDGGVPVSTFSQPLTFEVHYSDADANALVEQTLLICYQDESGGWTVLPTTVYPDQNIARATVNHLTFFALIGGDRFRQFLPWTSHP